MPIFWEKIVGADAELIEPALRYYANTGIGRKSFCRALERSSDMAFIFDHIGIIPENRSAILDAIDKRSGENRRINPECRKGLPGHGENPTKINELKKINKLYDFIKPVLSARRSASSRRLNEFSISLMDIKWLTL